MYLYIFVKYIKLFVYLHTYFYLSSYIFSIFILEQRDRERGRQDGSEAKALATKLDNLSLITGAHAVKEETGSDLLPSVHLLPDENEPPSFYSFFGNIFAQYLWPNAQNILKKEINPKLLKPPLLAPTPLTRSCVHYDCFCFYSLHSLFILLAISREPTSF